MQRHARLSRCRRYRYRLDRSWDPSLPRALFIGLNPSTADAQLDDPTIRRCIGFGRRWGCGSVTVVNLFAWRSTDPQGLRLVEDPVGPGNARALRLALREAQTVVACWGVHGGPTPQARRLLARLPEHAQCLGWTKQGYPRHPLFVRYATRRVPLKPERVG